MGFASDIDGDKMKKIADVEETRATKSFEDTESIDAQDAERYANAVVPQTDDPSVPSLTIRAVVLGILFGSFVGIVNSIFSFRTNSIYIPNGFFILLSLPIGVFLPKVLPKSLLNPGAFSIKEHILVYVIAGCSSGAPYGIDNVVGQHYFVEQENSGFWPSLLFVLTTQFAGYGLSGLTRRFLVRPSAMFWPSNFPDIALFRSLHETEEEQEKSKNVGSITRYSMFWLVFVFIFVWEFIPQYFASVLQLVSILCLFSKSNLASTLGSGNTYEGFGILTINFDWAITANSGALYSPFYATFVNMLGYVFFYWILAPIFHFTNPLGQPLLVNSYGLMYHDNTTFPAINEPSLFNSEGLPFDAADLLVYPDLMLNETMYNGYKPIYLTYQFAMDYFSSFLVLGAMMSHVGLWYGADIWKQTKEALQQLRQDEGDVHAELMKAYPDVPDWIYLVFAVIMLVLQIVVCQFTVYKLEWWGVIFGFGLALVYLIPVGVIQALTGTQIGLNVLTELVMGLIVPGEFVSVTTFKSFSYNTMSQALSLTSSLKLGHYMHINPVHMVAAQFVGTLVGAVTNTIAAFYVMDNLRDMLTNHQDWNPIGYKTFLNAGAIWGAIGPARFFGSESPYHVLLFGFLIGFVVPFLPWLGNRIYPSKTWHYVNVPLFFYAGGTGSNTSWITTGFIVAFIFQYYIFNYHYEWWCKYTYCVSSALDTGTNFAVLLISILISSDIVVGYSTLNPELTYDPYCFSPST